MALVIANVGEIELLDKMLKDALSVDEVYLFRLFRNNYTPLAASVVGDFTEANFTDYAQTTLVRASWGAATTVSNKASSTYATIQSWTCGASGNTVYGYYVVGATSGILLWAERFATSRVMVNGDELNLVPVFTFNSE